MSVVCVAFLLRNKQPLLWGSSGQKGGGRVEEGRRDVGRQEWSRQAAKGGLQCSPTHPLA